MDDAVVAPTDGERGSRHTRGPYAATRERRSSTAPIFTPLSAARPPITTTPEWSPRKLTHYCPLRPKRNRHCPSAHRDSPGCPAPMWRSIEPLATLFPWKSRMHWRLWRGARLPECRTLLPLLLLERGSSPTGRRRPLGSERDGRTPASSAPSSCAPLRNKRGRKFPCAFSACSLPTPTRGMLSVCVWAWGVDVFGGGNFWCLKLEG